jgi:hypothetical protein
MFARSSRCACSTIALRASRRTRWPTDSAEPWRAALLIADGERAGTAATAFGRLVEDLVGPNEDRVALAHAAP